MFCRLSAILAFTLLTITASAQTPRPATRNSTQPAEQARWCGRVTHTPAQPKSNQPVTITAMVAPAMTRVTLQYQPVDPGAYIEFKDPDYSTNWTELPMTRGVHETKKYAAYTAQLPPDLQKHRRLVRFRIKATDPSGGSHIWPTTPTHDDPSPKIDPPSNFAYFVYDALPSWTGAINPRGNNPAHTESITFPPEVLGRIQVYHLIARKPSIVQATWRETDYNDNTYNHTGTLVVDGKVYDHVRYRARGGIWRYALGKNMWKIDLPPGEALDLKDDYGRPYPVGWKKLNLRSCFQLGNYMHRGEQGMFEAVNQRLWTLVGVHAPHFHWVHLRILWEADENPAADQYRGDFWGLYQAMENIDGRFLKTHGLPDGNIYKMEIGEDELNHHADGHPADLSELKAFTRSYERARPTDQWWRENLDLPYYYSYRAIIDCVRHYDIGEGKNYSFYKNPKTKQWTVFPWDSDLSWADRMFGDGEEPFNSFVLGRPTFQVEYRNRLREVRDLLFNPEQTGRLIDETASIFWDKDRPNSGILEADRRKWDYHPAVTSHKHAGQGRYYKMSQTGDFAGMLQLMKDYVESRGFFLDQHFLRDPHIPATPSAKQTAPLKFTPTPYKGRNPFAAIKWRVARFQPPHYEITPTWESEDLTDPAEITLPPDKLKPGQTYRLRVRYKDTTNRWSHWSAPIEFTLAAQ